MSDIKNAETGHKEQTESTTQAETENVTQNSASEQDNGQQPGQAASQSSKLVFNSAENDFAKNWYANQNTQPDAENSSTPGQDAEKSINRRQTSQIIEASRWNGIFNMLAKIAPASLIVILICLCWHDFWQPVKAVYCPAELKTITAFLHGAAQKGLLYLYPAGLENNAWTAAQWPGFFWLTGILALIPGISDGGFLLPLSEALASLLALLGVWALSCACGFGGRAGFASAIILLCTMLFAPLPHFMGPAAFAAACMIWSLFFFYRGWQSGFSAISLPFAFILTGIAGLSGGLLHFAVPLLASFAYLIWSGKLKRASNFDAIAGFILMLAEIGIWLGWVILSNNSGNYLSLLFANALDYRFNDMWWKGLLIGIAGTMPWLLMIFGVSWLRVIKESLSALQASRKNNGSALIWSAFVLGCAASVIVPAFHPAAVAIGCLLAILLGKAFLKLSSFGNRFFFLLASFVLIIAGSIILAMSFSLTQTHLLSLLPLKLPSFVPLALLSLKTLPVIGSIVLAGGLGGLFFAKTNRQAGGLVYAILLVIIITQPARILLVPELAANPDLPVKKYEEIVKLVDADMAIPSDIGLKTGQITQDPAAKPITDEKKTETEQSLQLGNNRPIPPLAGSETQTGLPDSETAARNMDKAQPDIIKQQDAAAHAVPGAPEQIEKGSQIQKELNNHNTASPANEITPKKQETESKTETQNPITQKAN